MFPGNRSTEITTSTPSKFTNSDFTDVYIAYNVKYTQKSNNVEVSGSQMITNSNVTINGVTYKPRKQVCNQYIYFRNKDAYTASNIFSKQVLFPLTYQSREQLCTSSDEKFSYLCIKPGESVQIPIYIDEETGGKLAFDLRLSLYEDPVTYELEVIHSDSIDAKLLSESIKVRSKGKYKPIL